MQGSLAGRAPLAQERLSAMGAGILLQVDVAEKAGVSGKETAGAGFTHYGGLLGGMV